VPRLLANLHDDRGFDVSHDVETGVRSAPEAFAEHYVGRMRDLALQFYTVGGDSPLFTGGADPLTGALRRLEHVRTAVEAHPEFVIVERAADLDLVAAGRRKGLVLTIEGGAALGDTDTTILRTLHRLGLRSLNLLWFRANALGDGLGEPRGGGLTGFGREVLAESCRLGILPDVSQASERTTDEIVEAATVPVIASHSNARAVHGEPRNLSDDQIRAIAATGGLVGLNGFPRLVGDGEPDVDRLIDHLLHIAGLVGPEHVCFGLNIIPAAMDVGAGSGRAVVGSASHATGEARDRRHLPSVPDVTALPAVFDRLAARDVDSGTLDLVGFGNVERVLRAVLPRSDA
jgi:microsomal dipeptidase-like Zn-dependent dipeptidase